MIIRQIGTSSHFDWFAGNEVLTSQADSLTHFDAQFPQLRTLQELRNCRDSNITLTMVGDAGSDREPANSGS